MNAKYEFYVPPEGPPNNRLDPSIYRVMGEDNIYKMLEDFYLELEKSSIRHLFPEDMRQASKKSAEFFIFLLGGPPIYQQKHGSPMMRKRHMPFVIDQESRDIWLNCFQTILQNAEEKYLFPKEHKGNFLLFLEKFSTWMINSKQI